MCKAPASKFVEVVEVEGGALSFADEHVIGVAKGCDEEMIKDLNNHFMGEMYRSWYVSGYEPSG